MTTHQAIKKSYGVYVGPDQSGRSELYLWFNEDDRIRLSEHDVESAKELAEVINTLRHAVVGFQQAINCIGQRLLDASD
ncbi:hypothetical protein SAMN02745119_03075 [Trichlorobacter thiogenes]|uniref:Uncharacterized protein n=1 Tax=Trichlorobacter thiogenes TaxID=115783 RepID=A0A1T4RU74_9BACT|nr:hypothetical protein [Trichlorobacter thiogenes]SKA19540.1 hypothetical protein SAMN02745119_03075 [Trichlorobacter thiogenes]